MGSKTDKGLPVLKNGDWRMGMPSKLKQNKKLSYLTLVGAAHVSSV